MMFIFQQAAMQQKKDGFMALYEDGTKLYNQAVTALSGNVANLSSEQFDSAISGLKNSIETFEQSKKHPDTKGYDAASVEKSVGDMISNCNSVLKQAIKFAIPAHLNEWLSNAGKNKNAEADKNHTKAEEYIEQLKTLGGAFSLNEPDAKKISYSLFEVADKKMKEAGNSKDNVHIVELCNEVIDYCGKLLEFGHSATAEYFLGKAYEKLGFQLMDLGKTDEAKKHFAKAAEHYEAAEKNKQDIQGVPDLELKNLGQDISFSAARAKGEM